LGEQGDGPSPSAFEFLGGAFGSHGPTGIAHTESDS
jgi:hypothetical protein